MKKIFTVLLAIILTMSFAACGNNAGEKEDGGSKEPAVSQPIAGDGNYTPSDETLVVAHKANPTGLCFLTVAAVSANSPTMQTLYDRLLEYNHETNTVEPMLATEWEQIDDTHVRFKLREDVYAHDGSHFTANDVLYTVTTGQESGLLSNYYGMFNLAECKVEDDYTVVLATNEVDPYMLYTLSNLPLGMVVEEAVNAGGGLEAQGLKPTAGTGPYKFVEWVDGSHILLERNEEYWGNPAYYKNVEIRIITDASARVMNLESGDVDIALDPDTAQVGILEENANVNVISLPTSNITTMYLNCTKAPFNDENVRKAISLALNYEANLTIAIGGYGELTDSFLPISSSAYVSAEDGGYTSYFHYDVEAAKEFMAQSAYPNGFDFELIFAENPGLSSYAELIQNQLSQIGINVTISPLSSTVFYDYTAQGNFDAQISNASSPDPAIQLKYFDGRIDFQTLRGGCGWVDAPEELYELMDKAKVALDEAESEELYAQIQKIINEACPSVPLYSPSKLCATDSDIVGIRLTEYGDIDFSQAYRVS